MDRPKDYVDISTIKPARPRYAIWIAQDCAIYTRMARPNAWRRFWTWAFFGWRWTSVE